MANLWITNSAFNSALTRLIQSEVHPIVSAFLALKFLGVNTNTYNEVRSKQNFQRKFWEPYLGIFDSSGHQGFFKLFEGAIAFKGTYPHGSQFTPLRELRKPVGKMSLIWERDELELPGNDTTNYKVKFKDTYIKAVADQLTGSDGIIRRIPLDALATYMQAIEGPLDSPQDLTSIIRAWKSRFNLTQDELLNWFDESETLGLVLSDVEFAPADAKAVVLSRFPPDANSAAAAAVSGDKPSVDSKNIIICGPPGSGKSTMVDEWTKNNPRVRCVFYADTTRAEFVGTIRPIPIRETSENGKESLRSAFDFVPGPLTTAILTAAKSPQEEVFLIIEEINRADAASVFGEVLQLLDRDSNGMSRFPIAASHDLLDFFARSGQPLKDGELRLPGNLTIVATMNAADESLRPMDSAFKRRWDWHELPPDAGAHEFRGTMIEGIPEVEWVDFVDQLNDQILCSRPGEDCRIGLRFLTPTAGKIALKSLRDKLLPFLWQDVHRHSTVPLFSSDCTSLQTAQNLLEDEGLSSIFDWLSTIES
jgi:hypothetical protein